MCQSSVSSSLLAGWDWKVAIVETTPGIVLPHESFGFVSVIVAERGQVCTVRRSEAILLYLRCSVRPLLILSPTSQCCSQHSVILAFKLEPLSA